LTDRNPINADAPITAAGRLADSLFRRRIGTFLAEFVLIVAGVFIALAIDGWVGDARDRRDEQTYLQLLARDIGEIRKQAEIQIAFEREQLESGARAYAALGQADADMDATEIGRRLGLLGVRRTLRLSSATYEQMLGSGQLQLIRDYELRDRIVRFFANMNHKAQIIDKNNSLLVDGVYVPFLMRAGITEYPGSRESIKELDRSERLMNEYLGPDFVRPVDIVLLQDAGAESWNDIRRHVLFRLTISSVGMANAESILNEADEISQAIATEVNRR
jgi:hypothetical protein